MYRPFLPTLFLSLLLAAACSGDRPRASASPGDSIEPVDSAAPIRDSLGGSADPALAAGESSDTGRAPATVTQSGRTVPPSVSRLRDHRGSPAIRGLYVNRFAAHSSRRMAKLIGFADSTELNAMVIDMKDEFGLNYKSENPDFQRNAGSGHGIVRDVGALIDSLHAHGIMAIARIVVFKDPVAAALNPGWTIRTPEGAVWRDEKGNAWVNPYNREVWSYNIGVAEELARLGFDEIQFDYIRFPEPYRRLARQVFPGAGEVSKPDNLAVFLKEARERLHRHGVRSTADVFGLVTTVRGPLEIGQHWERLAPVTDVLLPMVYPSHYPRGSFGIAHPNAEPYRVIKIAIDSARVRNEKLGITAPEHVRPWIQAFSLGQPPYTAEHVREQKRAIYDAGYDGWILWHPGSNYDVFIPGLEKSFESRKKKSGG
jgi:hypothetical protein